jgi:uncharacterized protein YdeI (YjbR/CyaY-like superfamily)
MPFVEPTSSSRLRRADFVTATAATRAAWTKLSPAHRREHVKHVTEAKRAETRARRLAKTIEALSSGN